MRALEGLAGHAALRRLEGASLLWNAGEQVYLVGLLVLAHRAAGSVGVAAVGILQSLPAVALLPLVLRMTAGLRADILLRRLVAIRAAAITVAAVVALSGGLFALVLAAAAVDAVAATLVRPARSVLIPSIARTPEELVATNAFISAGRSLAGLAGPVVAAILIAGDGATRTLALGAILLALAAAATIRMPAASSIARTAARRRATGPAAPAGGSAPAAASQAPRRVDHLALIAGLVVGEQIVRGMLPVLVVGLALDRLGAGDASVGILNSAIGLGGLVGGAIAIAVVGRGRLAPVFGIAMALWGVGVAIPGLLPALAPAAAALAIAGIGRSALEVAGVTLLQRTVPLATRATMFGRFETLATLALAAGAVAGAILVNRIGASAGLVIAGALPIVLALVSWPALRSADAAATVPEAEIRLLRAAPMFRPLGLSTIEELAADSRRVTAEPGESVVSEGEPGDAFYIVEAGELSVEVDGRSVRTLDAGASFGEIALLRDTPRTATVRAIAPTTLVAIDREPFLAAVLGRYDASAVANDVIRGHLGD
jgi:hypothetical protein